MMSAERSKSDLKPGIVQIQGQTMAYLERAGKGETIVLIHGFTGNKDHWTRFVRYLPEDYRVLAFDMPGHGVTVDVKCPQNVEIKSPLRQAIGSTLGGMR